jgi:hypothetical protein
MKKLLEKDKKRCLKINKTDKKHFILKSIFKNSNFFFFNSLERLFKIKNTS